jgi:hypothetical protein
MNDRRRDDTPLLLTGKRLVLFGEAYRRTAAAIREQGGQALLVLPQLRSGSLSGRTRPRSQNRPDEVRVAEFPTGDQDSFNAWFKDLASSGDVAWLDAFDADRTATLVIPSMVQRPAHPATNSPLPIGGRPTIGGSHPRADLADPTVSKALLRDLGSPTGDSIQIELPYLVTVDGYAISSQPNELVVHGPANTEPHPVGVANTLMLSDQQERSLRWATDRVMELLRDHGERGAGSLHLRIHGNHVVPTAIVPGLTDGWNQLISDSSELPPRFDTPIRASTALALAPLIEAICVSRGERAADSVLPSTVHPIDLMLAGLDRAHELPLTTPAIWIPEPPQTTNSQSPLNSDDVFHSNRFCLIRTPNGSWRNVGGVAPNADEVNVILEYRRHETTNAWAASISNPTALMCEGMPTVSAVLGSLAETLTGTEFHRPQLSTSTAEPNSLLSSLPDLPS